jgi:hypothetical protein
VPLSKEQRSATNRHYSSVWGLLLLRVDLGYVHWLLDALDRELPLVVENVAGGP